MELTVSSAPSSEITKFSVGMGLLGFLVSNIPLGGLVQYVPAYLVALTMGPVWGALTGCITILDVFVYYPRVFLPDMFTFYFEWELFPALFAGPGQALLTGLLGLRIRPFYSLLLADLALSALPMLVVVGRVSSGFYPWYVWLLIGLLYQGVPLLTAWGCLHMSSLTQHFPGYTPWLNQRFFRAPPPNNSDAA